jgi:hypothetical protein
MCGHIAEHALWEKFEPELFVKQFSHEYSKYNFSYYPTLCLYNNGSFLNERELPLEARNKILDIIAKNDNIKQFIFETRLEYVTPENLADIKKRLNGKKVGVAIGLETLNDEVRDLCINKGFTLKQFEDKAKVVSEILNLRTYVLLKPPFLTEKEAIDDAVQTIKYAQNILKADSVHLEACTVQDYTLVHYLWNRGVYQTARLWSIIEILKMTNNIYVSPFRYLPLPKRVPHNCDKCTHVITKKVLKDYNTSLDLSVLSDLSCKCKQTWVDSLNEKAVSPLSRRINLILDELEINHL